MTLRTNPARPWRMTGQLGSPELEERPRRRGRWRRADTHESHHGEVMWQRSNGRNRWEQLCSSLHGLHDVCWQSNVLFVHILKRIWIFIHLTFGIYIFVDFSMGFFFLNPVIQSEATMKSEIHMFLIVLYVHIFSWIFLSFLACDESTCSKIFGCCSYCYRSPTDRRRHISLWRSWIRRYTVDCICGISHNKELIPRVAEASTSAKLSKEFF